MRQGRHVSAQGWQDRLRGLGTLTLSTQRSFPAFFADTREGFTVDHTGASIVAGVGQAATVPGYRTITHRNRVCEESGRLGRAGGRGRDHNDPVRESRLWCSGGQPHYLCCRWSLPNLQDTCT